MHLAGGAYKNKAFFNPNALPVFPESGYNIPRAKRCLAAYLANTVLLLPDDLYDTIKQRQEQNLGAFAHVSRFLRASARLLRCTASSLSGLLFTNRVTGVPLLDYAPSLSVMLRLPRDQSTLRVANITVASKTNAASEPINSA